MDGWNTTFLLGKPIFRCYVSFRECNSKHLNAGGLKQFLFPIGPSKTIQDVLRLLNEIPWDQADALPAFLHTKKKIPSPFFYLLSQWLTFWTFGDSIFSRENKPFKLFFQGPGRLSEFIPNKNIPNNFQIDVSQWVSVTGMIPLSGFLSVGMSLRLDPVKKHPLYKSNVWLI